MVINTTPAVKPLTGEELAELKRDIEALKEEQRADIEKVVPECITTNAQGNKNIELTSLKQNPATAARLVKYVKEQTKKNQQREWRRRRDVERRAKKQREKMEKAISSGKQWPGQGAVGADGQFVADPSKQGAGGLAAAQGMAGAQTQGQDMSAAVAPGAPAAPTQAWQQAPLGQNPQLSQLQPGAPLSFKPGAFPPLTAVPNAQQQMFNQMLMNGLLTQQLAAQNNAGAAGMTPAALQQAMSAILQMQQQPGNGQAQAALQKQQ